VKIASMWGAYGPIGRGWVPRKLGRHFCTAMDCAVVTRSGALLAIAPENLDVYCAILAKGGTWEPRLIDICFAMLRPGDVFFDIGSNAGIFGVELSKRLGGRIRVHSFEPQRALAAAIRRSVELNRFPEFTVHELALGDADRECLFYMPAHCIHGSLVPRQETTLPAVSNCQMRTLDAVVASGCAPRPDVVKIDVEGAELRVFQGARSTFAADPPVIIMEADENMLRFGYSHADLFRFLSGQAAGYCFYSADLRKPLQAGDVAGPLPFGNYVAIPLPKIERYLPALLKLWQTPT
jgi:FkbM family methyltransferase